MLYLIIIYILLFCISISLYLVPIIIILLVIFVIILVLDKKHHIFKNIKENFAVRNNSNSEINRPKRDKIIDEAIKYNKPVEKNLHVIICISNPCEYKRRWQLANEFIERMNNQKNITLYVVELIYPGQNYHVTEHDNPRHLRLETNIPIWHKESMLNLGIRKLLPKNWKAVAWVDADIKFENPHWAIDTLKILNGSADIVQPWTHLVNMDKNNNALELGQSGLYQYCNNMKKGTGINFWDPGFAWACNRKAYEKMGGLYDQNIIGGGDYFMALAVIQDYEKSLIKRLGDKYEADFFEYTNRCKELVVGYVPGSIKHFFHGHKKDRKYTQRYDIMKKHNFDKNIHLTRDISGLIIVNEQTIPDGFSDDIMNYFWERNEDI